MKLNSELVAWLLVAALILAGIEAAISGKQFEVRAATAEAADNRDRAEIARLVYSADSLARIVAKTDTIRTREVLYIAAADSASHPDSTCTASLAARDAVIATADKEIGDLRRQVSLEILARNSVTADRDNLRAALASRPKAALSLELPHPTLHVAAMAMVYPVQRVGIGVSLDLASLHL